EDSIKECCRLAEKDCSQIMKMIQKNIKTWGNAPLYGNRDFFLGMYERILMSLLIDGDRRDTEDFMAGVHTEELFSKEQLIQIWSACCENVEKKISELEEKDGIGLYRSEISMHCRQAAESKDRLFQLTVPTGSGKTLSSLRFAVHYALENKKKKIIYVAPFHSIVEQNAREIREALGIPEIVLEHHCNIVMETEEEQIRYDRITEDWSSPVIVTTAVQFLNTLFDAKTGNVRRMHSLCDSIIIMDEVQALPVRLLELFNLAANFLTTFGNAAMVLCTATQPLLERLPVNCLLPPRKMVKQSEFYREKLKRTEIMDCTTQVPGGMSIEQAARFTIEKAEKYRKVLFIVNTKKCAKEIFFKVKELCGEKAVIHHLSTSMVPEHRKETLEHMSAALEKDVMQICISTQVIEAGVNISFPCVIRSFAGLDNVIQAAGRCNRHMKLAMGYVFVIKMNMEAENISRLEEICMAQNALQSVLLQFRDDAQSLDNCLDSEKAITMYFEHYFRKYQKRMCAPVSVKGVPTSIVELLSDNRAFVANNQAGNKKGQLLNQAFQTAGEQFEVIDDMGKITVVVERGEEITENLLKLEDLKVSNKEKKQILRKLQQHVVSITKAEERQIGNGIRAIWEKQVLVLEGRFYDPEVGVVTEPRPMQTLMY
ncbi:MAG: CRISPR-associated helicase Cas3', partial [Lachnospiraceae bacterium]|nr:CRISPR-associated helicase Cas3' [Lachnospiraceae bacterium]